jgi:hypothetical protein
MAANASDYQQEIDKFFDLLKNDKVVESVSSIYKTNKYVSAIPDQIANVKNQLSSLSGMVGKINLIKKLDVYNVNDTFVHVTYIVTYDRQPVRFEFQFFKVSDGWRIYSFSFDDKIDNEVEMLARKQALQSNE